ncbi:MAG: ATP-dependent helicase/nuclease subunit [Clostridia bacterium]|jgi:ATP-dependent helicase/nuclease subunit A|nr:ATP-dependent helicase/nuclease subunit [Clostridia bacterium]
MGWTKPQQAAIDKRDAHILVSAAAGSGKTAVLTERVINRITGSDTEDPIEIDRFLIVTFTSAAANEMKERITSKLSDRISTLQNSDLTEDNEHSMTKKISYLERQIALIQTSSISTIHSFCLKVIKAYFNKLDIDPNIKVAGEAELTIMKMDILQEIIEEKFENEEEGFLKIAEIYGNVQSMAPLADLILNIYSFSKSTPFPEMWLDEKVQALCMTYDSLDEMPWSQTIKMNILNQVNDMKVLYNDAIGLCNLPNGPELYKNILEDDMRQIDRIEYESNLSEIISIINSIVFTSLPRKKQECDELLKERVKEYRNLGKEVIKAMQEDLAYISDKKVIAHLPKVGELMRELTALIKEFESRYQEAKQNAGIVDYNDLEHLCMQVLVEPHFNEKGELMRITYTDTAKELSRFYREVYIDEYQDSNTVQETILGAVTEAGEAGGPTRFMVGDMKQSIYRFRLANPLIFADKYEKWDKYSAVKDSSSKEICIDLSQNFRSRENILQGVNDIFEQLMSKQVGELEYDDYAKLKVGNHYQEGDISAIGNSALANDIEVHILETKAKEEEASEDESQLEELKNVELEALMVAALIDKILKGEGNPTHLFDKDTQSYRRVEPRDIVILLRATKNKAALFENALITKGIGAYADVNSSFFEAIEVQTMIAFIQIIDNPLQDIPLITVLRSPIVGASLDDLVVIRRELDKGCFYEALKVYLQREDAKSNIKHFMLQLQDYRIQNSQLTIEELLAKIYVETGYYRYVSMLPTGAKKKANLGMLRKYAGEFENNHHGKLFSFIQYLDKLKETSDGLGEAKLMGDNENLVRIMSIHKSKGLEFGIVFLCDTGKKFNNKDISNTILLHSKLGLAPEYIDQEEHVKYPTIPKLAVKTQIISENISEEMRVLYVALTRAKEKLFITGTVSDFTKKAKKWSLYAVRNNKQILSLGVKRAGSYLNWIGMSLFAHSYLPDIRKMAGRDASYIFKGQSKWQLTLWDKANLSEEVKEAKTLSEGKKELLINWNPAKDYGAYKEEIYKRLSYRYPYEKAIVLPTKLSVSEIKNSTIRYQIVSSSAAVQDERRIPTFIKEEAQLKGARRGTLIHSIFEHLDFLHLTTETEIKSALHKLVSENKILKEAVEVIDINRLMQISGSDMVARMRKAEHVWKEKQFVYLADVKTIDSHYPDNEKILIQGIIDTFFIEQDGVVMIDYKTDHVDQNNLKDSIQTIKDRYQRQLDLYAQAIEGITKVRVKEKVMYLYTINEWVQL